MKKRSVFLVSSLLVISALSPIFANVKIFKQHKVLVRDGKKIVKNCKYCHNDKTAIKKKKKQNYKKVLKSKSCSGKGCHK